jgi:hypothetical protein
MKFLVTIVAPLTAIAAMHWHKLHMNMRKFMSVMHGFMSME